MRQNLQVTLVFRAGIVQYSKPFETYGQPDRCYRIVIFIVQRFPIAPLGRSIILFLEIEVAHLNALCSLMRIPGMELVDPVTTQNLRFGICHCCRTLRVRLGIVRGRTEIQLRVFAGAVAYSRTQIVNLHTIGAWGRHR